jgi:hypothetical protein
VVLYCIEQKSEHIYIPQGPSNITEIRSLRSHASASITQRFEYVLLSLPHTGCSINGHALLQTQVAVPFTFTHIPKSQREISHGSNGGSVGGCEPRIRYKQINLSLYPRML